MWGLPQSLAQFLWLACGSFFFVLGLGGGLLTDRPCDDEGREVCGYEEGELHFELVFTYRLPSFYSIFNLIRAESLRRVNPIIYIS